MTRFVVLIAIILLGAVYRLLPHPANFAPITAMALFGGAYFQQKRIAFIVPLFTLWLSDLILNNLIYQAYFPEFTLFYSGFYWQYGSFLLITYLGTFLQNNVKYLNVLGLSLSASLLFFLISNFGVWASFGTYPPTLNGLLLCYIAGLPFLQNTILGDLFFCVLFFGLFEVLQSRFPKIQNQLVS
jgi:hypothetical protein